MASLEFNVAVEVQDNYLPVVSGRIADLSPAFKNIIDSWAAGSSRKFKAGIGMESSGVALDSDVFWSPLTDKYKARKQKAGFSDWLMHATGDLEATLGNPNGFYRAEMPQSAMWGTPWNESDAIKLTGNASKRTVLFFDRQDQLMIKKNIADYISLGEQYKELQAAEGLARTAAKAERAGWAMDWQNYA